MSNSPLVIENLSFRYRRREDLAIENINFELRAGQVMLIAGASGTHPKGHTETKIVPSGQKFMD